MRWLYPLLLPGCAPRMGGLDLSSPEVVAAQPAMEVGEIVRFAVLGDFGKHEDGAIPPDSLEILAHLDRVCADCDFVVLAGDNVYPNGVDGPVETAFLDALVARLDRPVWLVLGNHDWGAFVWPFGGAASRRAERELAWVRSNPAAHGDTHFWWVDAGPMRLVGLDSTWMMRRCNKSNRCRGQDLVATLAPAFDTDRQVVVAAHHAWRSDGMHGNAGDHRDLGRFSFGRGANYDALLDHFDPALHVAGHDHILQVLEVEQTLQVISGAGAKQRELVTEQPSLYRRGLEAGFAVIEVDRAGLTVQMHTPTDCEAFQKRGAAVESVPCPTPDRGGPDAR